MRVPKEASTPTHEEHDREFMRLALAEAEAAYGLAEVPVGCVVVRDGQVIGRGHNRRELDDDPTAHAEMRAIVEAARSTARESRRKRAARESERKRATGCWRLDGATLYVTLEPCAMCAGAIVLARIERLVFGARDPKAGACGSLYDIPRDERLNHRVEVCEGVLALEASEILKRFFRARRDGTIGKPECDLDRG